LPREKQRAVLAALVEGNSIRGTVRMTGVAKNTVARLLMDVGEACAAMLDDTLRDLPLRRVQLDEMWGFVGAKDKNIPADRKGEGAGSIWLWVAICADTRLVASYMLGDRTGDSARVFCRDLRARLLGRPQITTDGLNSYLRAIEEAFGSGVDYGMLDKQYETRADGSHGRYTGANHLIVQGTPDPKHVSTARVERQNLTTRMAMRRYIRQTNGFSRKIENLHAAVSLHYAHYNFCRPHGTLTRRHPNRYPTTPAMAAGVTDRVWTLYDLLDLIDYDAIPVAVGE
jgi:IS1 family transposase